MKQIGNKKQKIQSFTDLIAWKEAHRLAVMTYELARALDRSEFSMIDQIKRSSISISSNIAEGFSRKGKKEKIQFYYTAKGSLTELQNQLLLLRDVGCLTNEAFNKSANQTILVHKLINGLIKGLI